MLKSRVLLLQLMQNCFPMLPNPLEPRGSAEGATAAAGPSTSSNAEPLSDSVFELYTHLCHSKCIQACKQLGIVIVMVKVFEVPWMKVTCLIDLEECVKICAAFIFVMSVFQLWMVQKVRH